MRNHSLCHISYGASSEHFNLVDYIGLTEAVFDYCNGRPFIYNSVMPLVSNAVDPFAFTKNQVENTNSLLERALSNFKAHSFLWPRSSNSFHSKYSSTVKSQSN